jgi:Xaa-Pro aminopeptidase
MEHEVLRKLRAAMQADGFDALVAHSIDNVTYTAGFLVPSQASNRFRRTITVLAGDRFAAQIVVNVEEDLARERSRFADIRAYNQFTQDAADLLADALTEAGVADGRIAIELDFVPAQDYLRLVQRLPKAQFAHARDIYFRVRMLKTEEEIGTLRKVGSLTEQVMAKVLGEIRPGMRERELAARINDLMLGGGCDAVKIQVGSGVRSGITNCKPTDKPVEAGDVIRIEILGDMDNYRSNVTRTAVLGKPTEEQRRIWSVLIGARDVCQEMLRPGTRVPDLYHAYVNACRQGGIEPTLKFLGHGIGQTIHEEPYITETRDIVLAPSITHTMEPLYMLPGRMGFHVEDMYLITRDGYDRITGTVVPNDSLIELPT